MFKVKNACGEDKEKMKTYKEQANNTIKKNDNIDYYSYL